MTGNITNIEGTEIIKAGEVYSFYVNNDNLETNVNFNYWVIGLFHADSRNLVYPNVLTFTKDIIDGADYRFYCDDFTIPFDIDVGCYYLVA